MNAKTFLLLTAATCFGLPVLARTFHVPQDAPTIQAGLDSLEDLDTVAVSLGTYAEALYAPPLHFVLRGDVVPDTGDYPRPIIDPTPLAGADTLTCLTLPVGSSPIVEDLTFRNGLAMYPHAYDDGGIECHAANPIFRRIVMDSVIYALTVYQTHTMVTLDSCRFLRICQSGVLALSCAVYATKCLFSQNQGVLLNCDNGSIISGCRFEAHQSAGDYMLMIGGVQTQSSLISDCMFESSEPMMGNAIYAYYGGNGTGPHVEISGNMFQNLAGPAPIFVQYNYPSYATLAVTGNIFDNNHSTCCSGAIEFGQAMGFDQGILSEISGNLFANSSGHWTRASAVNLCAGANLTSNRFFALDSVAAPAVRMSSDTIESQLTLRDNLFWQTGTALHNDQVNTPVDAEFNWWGDSIGPYHAEQNPFGHGDTIVGNVDFTPWYPDTSFLLNVPGIGKPLPREFVLEAYPNPFNSTLHLKLIPSEVGNISVELFDILGRRTKEIWHGPLAFQKEIAFDASGLGSGIYFARVTDVLSRKNLAMRKVVLLK